MAILDVLLISTLLALLLVGFLFYQRVRRLEDQLTSLENSTQQDFRDYNSSLLIVVKHLKELRNKIIDQETESLTSVLADKIKKVGNINERFIKITDITRQQLDMLSLAEAPSKSAIHSKHQNDIARQLKVLEEEKRVIMQSILDDGIDPEITTFDGNGNSRQIKMSEALNGEQIKNKLTDKKSTKKNGNVINLFDKGEEDDKDDSGDSTIH
jgi:hypothetical protein